MATRRIWILGEGTRSLESTLFEAGEIFRRAVGQTADLSETGVACGIYFEVLAVNYDGRWVEEFVGGITGEPTQKISAEEALALLAD